MAKKNKTETAAPETATTPEAPTPTDWNGLFGALDQAQAAVKTAETEAARIVEEALAARSVALAAIAGVLGGKKSFDRGDGVVQTICKRKDSDHYFLKGRNEEKVMRIAS